MGVKPTFKQSEIKAYLQKKSDLIEQMIIRRLALVGLKCVKHARERDTYQDQTANLRNSIGFIIVRNGKIMMDNFEKSGIPKKADSNGDNGVKIGRSLAMSLVGKYRKGFALIVVAGMNYAVKVESKGYDVLTTAEQLAKTEVPKMMQQLNLNIGKMR